MTGTIKTVKEQGYGFITPDDWGQPDVFFHVSALQDIDINLLRPGDRVSYTLGEDPRTGRERAVQVRYAMGAAESTQEWAAS